MKELKSIMWTLIWLLVFYWASQGVIKLFGKNDDEEVFDAKVSIFNIIFVFFSFAYIIGIYHIVGPENVDIFYQIFIIFIFSYLTIGNFLNILIKNKF